jgi:hypothetical protein
MGQRALAFVALRSIPVRAVGPQGVTFVTPPAQRAYVVSRYRTMSADSNIAALVFGSTR